MKNKFNVYSLLFPALLVSLCLTAQAQVPPQESNGTIEDPPGWGHGKPADPGWSSMSMIDAPPRNENTVGTYSQNGKSGFVLPGGKRQELLYDDISPTPYGFIVQKNGLYGICNRQAAFVSKIEYDSIASVGYGKGDVFIVRKNGSYGSLNPEGKKILSLKYNKILFSDSRNPVSLVLNKKGELQILSNGHEKAYPQKLDYAELYANMVIAKINGKFGIIKGNETLVPFEYDSISYAYSNIKNTTARNIKRAPNPLNYNLSNAAKWLNCLIVQKNGKFGLLDSNGAVIYPAENDLVYYEGGLHTQSYYLIRKDKLFGAYFPGNKKSIPIAYESLQGSSYEGYLMAGKNKTTAVFNYQAEEIIPAIYNTVTVFNSQYFVVSQDGKKGLTDNKGKLLLPVVYEEINTFYNRDFDYYISVKRDKKYGVVNYRNETIIPLEYEFVSNFGNYFMVVTADADRYEGLYDKDSGKLVVPAEYSRIKKSATENSKLIILKRNDSSYNFLDTKGKILFNEDLDSYGYVHNEENLLNPFSMTRQYLLYIKNKNGKFGAFDEKSGELVIPMVYDTICQRFEKGNHIYYSVRKGKKYGLINEHNKIIIPLEYDAISLNLIKPGPYDKADSSYFVVVAKGKKYGVVNLNNKVQIPFEYAYLERISNHGLYKARKGKYYQIINSKNEIINKGPFDDIANYEQTGDRYSDKTDYKALSFYNGKMRVVNEKGSFISEEVPMQMHKGYTTFDELKGALVKALDSKDNNELRDFADKIAPSEHILYYLKENLLSRRALNTPDLNYVREKYYKDLLQFKQQDWQVPRFYNRKSLTAITDFTLYDDRGAVSNGRTEDHAFGDTRFLEKVLRNSYKINGFWISSYFMSGRFER